MLTASDIKSYFPEHTVLVLISVLKAKHKSPKRNVKLLAVTHIYHEICREYNLEIIYRRVLDPLKMLDMAGLIKIRTNKEGITSIVAIGYGDNTSEVMENILYSDPDYAKYKDFVLA
jgi:Cdc6-like AAA superfamily ATPase